MNIIIHSFVGGIAAPVDVGLFYLSAVVLGRN